jgi:hypothetical protein
VGGAIEGRAGPESGRIMGSVGVPTQPSEEAAEATVPGANRPRTVPAARHESGETLLFSMGGIMRVFVWSVALFLTAAILLYPVHLRLVDSAIQSVDVIENLPLFAALYYSWLLSVLALLFSRAGPTVNHREKVALVALFALVFWGFWTINTPQGQTEEPAFLAYAKYLENTGHISLTARNFTYFDFPGLGLFSYAVSNVMGLSHLDARTLIMLSNAALTALFLYHLYRRAADSSAKPSTLYLLAVPLVIQSNMMLSVGFFFRPENAIGLLFLMGLLVLLAANSDESTFFGRWQSSLMAIALFAALMVTHFMTSLAFVAVLGGLYLVRAASGRRMATASTIALFVVMTGAWQLYYAVRTFGSIADSVPYFVDLVKEGDILFYAFTLGAANVGGDVPLWATAARLFWMAAIYILAGLLALLNLTRLRRLGGGERDYTGALLGIGVMTAVVALVNGTGDQIARYVEYGAFFAVPVVLAFMARTVPQRWGLCLVVVPFFLLSLPTFLAFHSQIALASYYPQEHRAAQFLRSQYGDAGEDLALFTGIRDRHLYLYYFPSSDLYSSTYGILKRDERAILWEDTGNSVSAFVARRFARPETKGVFVFSQGFQMTYQHLIGVSPDDVEWLRMRARLATTNAFYDNGQVQLYLPPETQE